MGKTAVRHPIWLAVATAALTAAVMTGCSAEPEAQPASPALSSQPSASIPALPRCADVFQVGQSIDKDKAAAGCLDPDGGTQIVGSFRCNDGRRLFQVDANTGAPAGFGFGGSQYVASKESASDPAYSKAYQACNG